MGNYPEWDLAYASAPVAINDYAERRRETVAAWSGMSGKQAQIPFCVDPFSP